MKSETKFVRIDELITDGLQIRVALNEEAIRDYAEAMKEGHELPPVIVYGTCLADGFHRMEAAKRIGRDTLLAEVREGGFDDALTFALSANDKHGVRRTNADKRHALEVAWTHRMTLFPACVVGNIARGPGDPSSTQLAEICGVDQKTALEFMKIRGEVRKFLTSPRGWGESQAAATPENAVATPSVGDATRVTREHLEERNASARRLLKQGRDRYGVEIPEAMLPVFKGTALRQILGNVRGITKAVNVGLREDVQFRAVPQRVLTLLANLRNELDAARPFCVCRSCRGTGCGYCSDRGFQTKLQFDRTPSEFKPETK